MNWTGVVLTGGRSSRMGRDKALIQFEGRTLLQRALDLLAPHTDDLLVIGDTAAHTDALASTIGDEHRGMGPLGGLVTALKHARHELVVVVACDMPGLTETFIERIQLEMTHQADAIVPEHEGLIEPLAACYHRHCLAPFERCIAEGTLKLSDALERVRTLHIPIHPGTGEWPAGLFRNINAPGDL